MPLFNKNLNLLKSRKTKIKSCVYQGLDEKYLCVVFNCRIIKKIIFAETKKT